MADDQILLTRREAAALCRVSLAAFERHVRPNLTSRKIGRRVLFLRAELQQWLEQEPAGIEPKARRELMRHGGAASRGASVVNMNDPRVQETLARMRASRARRESHNG